MAARKATSKGRQSHAQQDFLSKPARRRRRPATRQQRQEQGRPLGVRSQSQQPRKSLPRPHRARIVALVLLIGLVSLVIFLFTDASFYVETATVNGLQYASAEEVYRQAAIDQYSIFWVNPREAAQRIEALPYVKRAAVYPALPNQVRIEIEEREPVVVWKVGGQEYWVDSEGIPMPVARPLDNLPSLWDLDGSTVANGQLDRQLIASLRQVKQQVPEVTDFGYDSSNGLQFRLPSGTFVYLGMPEGMAQRVASLLVLHQSLASQGQAPAEINWRVENGYYLRLAQ